LPYRRSEIIKKLRYFPDRWAGRLCPLTKIKILRIVTASLVILVVVSGAVGELRYGGICSLDVLVVSITSPLESLLRALGVWPISVTFTCPLGFLERSLASRELLRPWLFSVAWVVLSVILLGRVFCAWVCPAVLLRRVWRGKGGLKSKREAAPKGVNWASYSPYAVLAGVLVASFLFRFPVFCFFCPIGLFFGALYAVIRLFSPHSLSPELVLFPAMLVLELWVLKSWCRSICPLGALLSIIGSLNRFILPVLRKEKCLTSKGANCGVCERACHEGIDLAHTSPPFFPNSCTKCLECYEKCPAGAVKIAIFR
jgi:ferredoxin-type protein NapH